MLSYLEICHLAWGNQSLRFSEVEPLQNSRWNLDVITAKALPASSLFHFAWQILSITQVPRWQLWPNHLSSSCTPLWAETSPVSNRANGRKRHFSRRTQTDCLEEPQWSKHGHPQISVSASFFPPTGTGFFRVVLRESTPADWGLHLLHKGYCHSHASLNSCLTPELNTWHTGSTKPKQTNPPTQPPPFFFISFKWHWPGATKSKGTKSTAPAWGKAHVRTPFTVLL